MPLRPAVTTPVVGMPATICGWSDRYPCTVVSISKSGKRLKVREDKWEVVSGSMHDGTAQYKYEEDLKGNEREFRLASRGKYAGKWVECKGSNRLYLGEREKYYDPHF